MYAMFYILLKVDTEGRNDSSGCTLSLLTIKNPRFQVLRVCILSFPLSISRCESKLAKIPFQGLFTT